MTNKICLRLYLMTKPPEVDPDIDCYCADITYYQVSLQYRQNSISNSLGMKIQNLNIGE